MDNNIRKTIEDDINMMWELVSLELDKGGTNATETSPLTKDSITQRGVILGIDTKHRYHLILKLSEKQEKITRRLTNGIIVRTTNYLLETNSSEQYIDIIADKKWKFAITPFALDLIMSMKDGSIDIDKLMKITDEYMALWRAAKEPMDLRSQRGLIGEMLSVKRIGETIGLAATIDRWEGQYGSLHDIVDDDWRIEIKSYADEPPRVRISEVEQLDYRIDARLTLLGIHILGTSEGKTLPEFVDDFLLLSSSCGMENRVKEILSASGYDNDRREEYSSRFSQGGFVICPITEHTPVLDADILYDAPHSVDKITYRLALNDLFHLDPKIEQNWELITSNGSWSDEEFFANIASNSSKSDKFSVIEQTERIYRKLAHEVYTKTHGKNWWKYIPSSVKSSQFKRKIEEWKKKGVKGLDQPSLKYWDAMTTSALHECITTNKMWPKFKTVLNVSSSNFNMNWQIFSDLRNTFAHSNDAISDNHLDQGISTSKILHKLAVDAQNTLDEI